MEEVQRHRNRPTFSSHFSYPLEMTVLEEHPPDHHVKQLNVAATTDLQICHHKTNQPIEKLHFFFHSPYHVGAGESVEADSPLTCKSMSFLYGTALLLDICSEMLTLRKLTLLKFSLLARPARATSEKPEFLFTAVIAGRGDRRQREIE